MKMVQASWTCVAAIVSVVGGCSDSGTDAANDESTSSIGGTQASSSTSGTTGQTVGGTASSTVSGTTGVGPQTSSSSAASTSTSSTVQTTGATTSGATTTGFGMSSSGSNDVGTMGTGGGGASNTDSSTGGTGTETSGSTATDGAGGADNPGPCTESQSANSNASGSGPHDVVVETNSDAGINEGTIFRPGDLGSGERYPIFVWGQGACSRSGLSAASAMAEIASHGYFVIADGTPNGSGSRSQTNDVVGMARPLIAYIDWAVAENTKPCSAYYHSLDTTKISANGFSCGGLMAEGTAGDPRITTWGITSSGLTSSNPSFYETIHTPVLIVEGGPSDIAYQNGQRDYDNISPLGVPLMWFSKDIGHGGDLFQNGGGDFTKIILAWLNWWLKGDETATGKGVLVGAGCSYCSDSAWEVESANLP